MPYSGGHYVLHPFMVLPEEGATNQCFILSQGEVEWAVVSGFVWTLSGHVWRILKWSWIPDSWLASFVTPFPTQCLYVRYLSINYSEPD